MTGDAGEDWSSESSKEDVKKQDPKTKTTANQNSNEAISTRQINALQSAGQRKLLDLIDQLRRAGLSGILQLPQIVVCGDQSSGKSSVLEAITGINFPRKENLCTRFATQFILRRDVQESVSTKIIPDSTRGEEEKIRLSSFKGSLTDLTQLPELIDAASAAMGLSDIGDGTNEATAFSKDVLSIEICGPDRPQLTLVDLPGLIHSSNKSQSTADVQIIKDLVETYISNKRTIILAVISAKNDYANQIILKKARDADAKGSRTLGIITKPDFLRPGSENEKNWLDLAQNKDIYFELGWHMVKNRSDEEHAFTSQERDQAELAFFSTGAYASLSQDTVGIASLRARLAKLLNNHLKKELPVLKEEVMSMSRDNVIALEKLGKKRSTPSEQRQYLMAISTQTQDIIKAASQGYYDHVFFKDIDISLPVTSAPNHTRLRAVVQQLNLSFAKVMHTHGHTFQVNRPSESEEIKSSQNSKSDSDPSISLPGDVDRSDSDAPWFADLTLPIDMTKAEATAWVQSILTRTRGQELPGSYNPALIDQIFWEQSKKWKMIAVQHIEAVHKHRQMFIRAMLEHLVDNDTFESMWSMKIEPALEESLALSLSELTRLIEDKARPVMSYNPSFASDIQSARLESFSKSVVDAANQASSSYLDGSRLQAMAIHTSKLKAIFAELPKPRIEEFSAWEALDSQIAYYEEERAFFIAAVTKQVIERHMISGLASDIISPMSVAQMSDEELAYIGGEPEDLTRRREHLETRQKMLDVGMQMFRQAFGN